MGVHAADPTGRLDLTDISLSLRPGEIVGAAAIAGNGQRELGDVLLGIRPIGRGSMTVLGRAGSKWSPAELLNLGFGCVPEDALQMGAVASMSGLENMSCCALWRWRCRLALGWSTSAAKGSCTWAVGWRVVWR